MNKIIKEIVRDSRLDVYGLGKDYSKWDETVTNFVNQVVGEAVLAILATDTRSMTYTTYDKSVVDAVISRAVDSVRNHFKETENV